MDDASAQNNYNFRVGKRPRPGHHERGIPARPYSYIHVSGSVYFQPKQVREGAPDGHQRKLALKPFDRKELNNGLGSDFLE